MQREIIIFLYAFWTVRRVVGRNTSWMKNQREPSDGKEATREHGNCVSIFSAFSFTFKCCFRPHVTCYWEGCVFFSLQGGSEGGWIWLPQSLRWGDSFPIQKEKVSMFIHAKRWDMVLLQHWKFPIMCCWVFLFRSLWQLCHTDVLSLWHVCFSKFHRIIESYGQVRLGMVSQKKKFSQTSLFSVLHFTFKKWVATTE